MCDELRLPRLRYRSGLAEIGSPGLRRLNARPIVAVGVDRGGSWIRVVGLDAAGRKIRSIKTVSLSLENLPRFFRTLFKTWNIQPRVLAVASRGVWKSAKRKVVARSLKKLAPHIHVISDVEAAWLAAFGRQLRVEGKAWRVAKGRYSSHSTLHPSRGILIISGTGSIAYAKDSKGRSARAGGMGPDKGDEGSGFWIGKEWAKTVPEPLTPATVREIAARAPQVWRLAQKKNPRAQHIIQRAQAHLTELVKEILKITVWKGVVPLACAGSVLAHPGFRRGFIRTLKRALPDQTFHLTPLRTDPATAAARYAARSSR